jgi:hypothetical protein
MEQRSGERKAVSLDAVVGCPRFGLIRGRIVDLSLGGLYISAETSIVPIGAQVTVTFQPGDELCDECLSVCGRVSHQSLHGFGIAFEDLGTACRQVLDRMLPDKPAVPIKAAPILRAI